MLLHAMSLLVMRRLLVEVELLRDQAELIVLPPPCPLTSRRSTSPTPTS